MDNKPPVNIQTTETIQQAPTTQYVADKSFATKFKLNSATPGEQNVTVYQTNSTNPTTITNFLLGQDSNSITILAADGNTTIANNANIKTNTGADKLLTQNMVYRFTLFGLIWYEDA